MLQGFNTRNRHPPWDPDSDFASMESDLGHLEKLLQMHIPLLDAVAPHRFPDGVIVQANVAHVANLAIHLIRDARGAGCLFQSTFYGNCSVVAGTILALHLPSPVRSDQ